MDSSTSDHGVSNRMLRIRSRRSGKAPSKRANRDYFGTMGAPSKSDRLRVQRMATPGQGKSSRKVMSERPSESELHAALEVESDRSAQSSEKNVEISIASFSGGLTGERL